MEYTSRRPPVDIVAAQRAFCLKEGLAIKSDDGPDGISIT